uniref:Uncharacterized protein n=1 Tax=Anguilla anguilla TaxID=7936 RepID=A0A0E9VLI3_ANGAN
MLFSKSPNITFKAHSS